MLPINHLWSSKLCVFFLFFFWFLLRFHVLCFVCPKFFILKINKLWQFSNFETFQILFDKINLFFAAGKFEDDEGDGTDGELSSKRGHALSYSRGFPASQRMDRAGLGTISLEVFKTHDRVIPLWHRSLKGRQRLWKGY